MQKGTGNVEVADDGVINVSDAQDVFVRDSKADDKIYISNSKVSGICAQTGTDTLTLNGCTLDKNSVILFGGFGFLNEDGDTLYINGDCNGTIKAQQGSGSGRGDAGARKDAIYISGDNNARIEVDSQDKVSVKGEQNGRLANTTKYVTYC